MKCIYKKRSFIVGLFAPKKKKTLLRFCTKMGWTVTYAIRGCQNYISPLCYKVHLITISLEFAHPIYRLFRCSIPPPPPTRSGDRCLLHYIVFKHHVPNNYAFLFHTRETQSSVEGPEVVF